MKKELMILIATSILAMGCISCDDVYTVSDAYTCEYRGNLCSASSHKYVEYSYCSAVSNSNYHYYYEAAYDGDGKPSTISTYSNFGIMFDALYDTYCN